MSKKFDLMSVMGQFGKNLTAEKTAEIIERDGSVVTGFVVTDKYGTKYLSILVRTLPFSG